MTYIQKPIDQQRTRVIWAHLGIVRSGRILAKEELKFLEVKGCQPVQENNFFGGLGEPLSGTVLNWVC